jgi:hypothetical protein
MIGAVSSGHNGFENAAEVGFPYGTKSRYINFDLMRNTTPPHVLPH